MSADSSSPPSPAAVLSPVELTQRLVRFNTSNPASIPPGNLPGDDLACAQYLKSLLDGAGIPCEMLGPDPLRPNVLARLPGAGRAAPLLLQGHMDAVPAGDRAWEKPPFGGEISQGFLWGRGALDMKSGLAMMVTALLRLKAEGITPPGDIILALLADEEAGGDAGARFLVERHPERFEGVRYGIGEFGGFAFVMAGRRFYPIMVAEKQVCRLRATLRGPGGHGSLAQQNSPMAAAGRLLQQVQERTLPVHVTPAARTMFRAIGAGLPLPARVGIAALLTPSLSPLMLKILGKRGRTFGPLLRNTVNATVVRGGEASNVVPEAVTVDLDGRVLPGLGPEDLIAELRDIVGEEIELELLHYDPAPDSADMGLFPVLADVLREVDQGAIPVPMLMPAATDGRLFARLGIQTYGFLPMNLPQQFDFAATVHGINERIPVDAIEFGARAMFRLVQTFGRA